MAAMTTRMTTPLPEETMFTLASPVAREAGENARRDAARGRVELAFARDGARTVLIRQYATTPLHVQGVLGRRAPDDPCAEVAVLNVAGGVMAGDLLEQDIVAEPGAAVRALTVGAARIYRAPDDTPARMRTTLRVGAGARIEYLPDELIPYAGALYESETTVELEPGGQAIVSEVVGPGRLHRGELFAYRRLDLCVRAGRAGQPLLRDALTLEPARWPPMSGPILGPYTHLATLYVFGLDREAAASLATEFHTMLEDRGVYGGATLGHGGTVVLRAAGGSAYTLLQIVRAAANRTRKHMMVPKQIKA